MYKMITLRRRKKFWKRKENQVVNGDCDKKEKECTLTIKIKKKEKKKSKYQSLHKRINHRKISCKVIKKRENFKNNVKYKNCSLICQTHLNPRKTKIFVAHPCCNQKQRP